MRLALLFSLALSLVSCSYLACLSPLSLLSNSSRHTKPTPSISQGGAEWPDCRAQAQTPKQPAGRHSGHRSTGQSRLRRQWRRLAAQSSVPGDGSVFVQSSFGCHQRLLGSCEHSDGHRDSSHGVSLFSMPDQPPAVMRNTQLHSNVTNHDHSLNGSRTKPFPEIPFS